MVAGRNLGDVARAPISPRFEPAELPWFRQRRAFECRCQLAERVVVAGAQVISRIVVAKFVFRTAAGS